MLFALALGAWLTISDDASGIVIFGIGQMDPNEALSCPDWEQPQAYYSGNPHVGWITRFGCGPTRPASTATPGGCKVGSIYIKPIVAVKPETPGKWSATIYCPGEGPRDNVS
jgi:hypothetical protein